MAKIWPVYEGGEPTRGGPWANIPISDAKRLFDLKHDELVTDLSDTPRFGPSKVDFSYLGYRYIVIEIGQIEGRQEKWKPGYYRSSVTPAQAYLGLVQHALESELGRENVVRVNCIPTIDSWGNDAIKITVVIGLNSANTLSEGASLDALVRLKDQLGKMRDERTPMIEYTTEEELASDAAP